MIVIRRRPHLSTGCQPSSLFIHAHVNNGGVGNFKRDVQKCSKSAQLIRNDIFKKGDRLKKASTLDKTFVPKIEAIHGVPEILREVIESI